MKKLLAALLGAALLLGACGSNEDAGSNSNGGDNNSSDAVNGESVYMGNCAGCHGEKLDGASGPAIAGYDVEKVLKAIEEGPGTMPAGLVTGQDAEDVAAWISKQK